ncbi:MAG: ethanolamine ammonia-lyase subunit EutC [Steroidobacteraceae bacterium]
MNEDPWLRLKGFTAARIGLGRTGASLPTREVLAFSMAHAQARDAVRRPMDWAPLESGLAALQLATVRIASRATERDIYLRRPDLGRRLDDASRSALASVAGARPALLLIIGDGLSSTAVSTNALPLVAALLPHMEGMGMDPGTVLLAAQARVGLADEAGGLLQAHASLMLIGERPGLSSPDSLGAYLTWEPRVGRHDGERNCVSNIRTGGLSHAEAAFRIAWLLRESFRRRLSGVALKDESQYELAAPVAAERLT